jgi:hypothetical protein
LQFAECPTGGEDRKECIEAGVLTGWHRTRFSASDEKRLANLKANALATHLGDAELGKSNVLINLHTVFSANFSVNCQDRFWKSTTGNEK